MQTRRIVALVVGVALVATGCWHVPHDYAWDQRADVVWTTHDEDGTTTWWSDRQAEPLAVIEYSGALPVAGDFDGDGRYDYAVAHSWDRVLLDDGTEIVWDYPPNPSCERPPDAGDGFPQGPLLVVGDWDGDRADELGWYCAADATWWLPGAAPVTFGQGFDSALPMAWDLPAPADYDGDGTTDLAVYRIADGTWWVEGDTESTAAGFGIGLPVPADYDGDGTDDPVVWEAGPNLWRFADGTEVPGPGEVADSLLHPAPADYDGDGSADLAIVADDPSGSTILVGDGRAVAIPRDAIPTAVTDANVTQTVAVTFMAQACATRPVDPAECPRSYVDGDFDGDGLGDPVWFKQGWGGDTSEWRRGTEPDLIAPIPDGALGVAGDYDGDGRWETASVDELTGEWVTHGSRGTFVHSPPGSCPQPDPVVADLDHDGRDEGHWYCDTTGTWHLADGTTVGFGTPAPHRPDWAPTSTFADYHDVPLVLADYLGRDSLGVYRPTDGTFRRYPGDVVVASGPPLGIPAGGRHPGVWRVTGGVFTSPGQPDWSAPSYEPGEIFLPGLLDLDGDGLPERTALSNRHLTGDPIDTWDIEGSASLAIVNPPASTAMGAQLPATISPSVIRSLPRLLNLELACYQDLLCPPGFDFPDHVDWPPGG